MAIVYTLYRHGYSVSNVATMATWLYCFQCINMVIVYALYQHGYSVATAATVSKCL